jgi:hypothetical protein
MMAILFVVGQKLEPPSIVTDLLACHPDPVTGAPAIYPKKPQVRQLQCYCIRISMFLKYMSASNYHRVDWR